VRGQPSNGAAGPERYLGSVWEQINQTEPRNDNAAIMRRVAEGERDTSVWIEPPAEGLAAYADEVAVSVSTVAELRFRGARRLGVLSRGV
jgi:hypothetical protein